MKAFLKRHGKLHLWLAADVFLLAAYLLFRQNRGWMNALASGVTGPLRRALGRLCYRTEVSVMEILCVALVVVSVGYLLWSVIAVARAKGARRERAYSAALCGLCAGLSIYAGFCLLWGVNYWTDSFQDRSGIRAEAVTKEELARVAELFARRLTAAAGEVPRDEDGLFAVSRAEILEKSPTVYDALEGQFPFLRFEDTGVKAMRFSRLMSAIDFTGFYCPYTGEANVNVDSPACLLPSTAAHEMAHQRGIASEQECNFLAVLASTTSGEAAYAYAGWLMGYIHLGNALYLADPDAYWAIRGALPEGVEADLRDNTAYWDQFRDRAAQKVSNKVYDGLLKSYGDENGIRSYGTVVDLLVAYYK
ncbi:DUF3810 domain-containing protein [Oscillibacter sp.]|uniref:DUF3810 domain-containing protein n=1 Tax=Oscillibacter sp. TaxID=1945593 RepID=UPI002621A8FB|nr:DUF3810 domain-containing protein [Oscillibacter sp.]MDD3346165.1 DUF3810 domain-containing protein [Oscillibacter sp.]